MIGGSSDRSASRPTMRKWRRPTGRLKVGDRRPGARRRPPPPWPPPDHPDTGYPSGAVRVELVDQRNSRRDVQFDDRAVRYAVQVLDQRPQRIAVGGNQHASTRTNVRRNRVLPVRHEARHRIFERFGRGQVGRRQRRVARVPSRMSRVVRLERRWRHVVAAPPDLRLRLAVFCGRLRLVEPLQRAVVPLVQPPASNHGNPEQVELVERDPASANRALEDRRVRDVEPQRLRAQKSPRFGSLPPTLIGQIDISPASESILLVPG